MAFFVKNFEGITAALIQKVSQSTAALTDFNIGSKTRTMLEAFAEELELFYLQMFRGILEGIDDAVFSSFDFPPLPAVAASGPVIFSLVEAGTTVALAPTSNIVIPKGLRVQIPVRNFIALSSSTAPSGTTYEVLTDTLWLAGQQRTSVLVACLTAGTVGNTAADSITGLADTFVVVQGGQFLVTNPVPFVNGVDQEDQISRKARFGKYLQSLGRGTLAALEYAAVTAVVKDDNGAIVEQVKKAIAIEPYQVDGSLPIGHADILVFNGVGNTSPELVDACQQIIDGYIDSEGNRVSGYKAAGIIAKVKAAIEVAQLFDIRVELVSGYSLTSDITDQIKGAIARYVSSLNPGQTLVYNKIIELVMDITGIYNCIVASPTGDVVLDDPKKIVTVGDITVSEDTDFEILSETYTT